MLRIAICDDSEYVRKETNRELFNYCMDRDIDYTVKEFENGESFLKEINNYDLVLLDYQFENKGKDGMSIAREIRKINSDIIIIFLSSYTNIVYDTFEVDAFRFLVKPIDKEKFYAAMDDCFKTLQNDNTLIVKVEGTSHYIKENQISYAEGNGKKSIIHFINKEEVLECNETLSSIMERLSERLFYRCHKSFLVNMKYVESFNHTDLMLQNKKSIMISRQKYKSFCEAYSEFLVKSKVI